MGIELSAAGCDGDGTFYRGNAGRDFLPVLVRKDLFDRKNELEIKCWYLAHTFGLVGKELAVRRIYESSGKGLIGRSQSRVLEEAEKAWKTLGEKVYPFASGLIKCLQDKGFEPVLLSGSPWEIVAQMARQIGIPETNVVAGTVKVNGGGVYTGEVTTCLEGPGQKLAALQKFAKENNLVPDQLRWFGIGNDHRDYEILGAVGLPAAINANGQMRRTAKREGWLLVTPDNALDKITEMIKARNVIK
jgi:phosphoserine phosphatase